MTSVLSSFVFCLLMHIHPGFHIIYCLFCGGTDLQMLISKFKCYTVYHQHTSNTEGPSGGYWDQVVECILQIKETREQIAAAPILQTNGRLCFHLPQTRWGQSGRTSLKQHKRDQKYQESAGEGYHSESYQIHHMLSYDFIMCCMFPPCHRLHGLADTSNK